MPKKQQFERGEELDRVLFLCDQQVPFHDPRAVGLAAEYARVETLEGRGFTEVVQGGDWADMTALSIKFLRHPEHMNRIRHDFKIMRGQHERLSEAVGWDIPHRWIAGNHEERFAIYIIAGNPELAWLLAPDDDEERPKLDVLRISGMDRFDNISYTGPYGEVYERRYGRNNQSRFIFKHGDKAGVYAAARELDGVMENGMSGHNHRAQTIMKTTYNGPKAWWSIPALCNIEGPDCPPGYMKGNGLRNWQQGFGEAYFSRERALFAVQTHIIHRGLMIAGGRMYRDVRGKIG